MKNNKKLVVIAGAAALGLVAATGVTSGFAWFAVNTTVSASSLDVSAKANASYLLINTAAEKKATPATTIAGVDPTSTSVYPVSKAATTITHGSVTINSGEWYTATVNKRDAATPGENGVEYTSVTKINMGNDDYFVHYDFYLYLADGSTDLTNQDLTVTVNFNNAHASVKMAVTIDESNYYVLESGSLSHTFNGVALKVPSATTDYVHFEAEIFIDGTNSDVKSATNISTLAGSGIGLTFATANAA